MIDPSISNGVFKIDSEALDYIRNRCRGEVTIIMDFQPTTGGG